MRKHPRLILGAAALLLAGACARTDRPARFEANPAQFSGESAFKELKRFVGLGLRDSGAPGAANAARYLVARLKAMELEVAVNEFEDMTPQGPVRFRNVVARIPGAGTNIVILASHYDTKSGIGGEFEGANDSGSSTAVLLEIARVLSEIETPPPSEIRLAFFDGEECMENYGPVDGLHGSRHMVKSLRERGETWNVLALVLLDMVGDRMPSFTIPRNSSPPLVSALFTSAREEGEDIRTLFTLYPFEIGDDHDPFLRAGIPALDIIDFLYGSSRGRNDYWHTPEDRLDKIDPATLQIVGRVTLRLLNRILYTPVRTPAGG